MTEAQFIINNINMYYDGVFNRLQNKNQVLHTQPFNCYLHILSQSIDAANWFTIIIVGVIQN